MTRDRRSVIAILLGSAAGSVIVRHAYAEPVSQMTAFAFTFKSNDGGDIRLADFAGRPLLIVNTASQCGYTPQYAELAALWTEFQPAGLMVIAVPSNDFGGQEPGGSAEIAQTTQHFGISFPVAAKTVVKGADAHPFYKWAARERPADLPAWNFHKYLIGREGHVAEVFASAVSPTDVRIKAAISRALAAS